MSAATIEARVKRHGADVSLAGDPALLAKTRMFHTMDALRGVGAAGVVMFHAAFLYGFMPREGQSAVDLFFVMSGFIIAYRYESDLHAGLGFTRFLKIRFVRLYPLYILGTILGLIPALVALAAGAGNAFHRGLVESFPLALLMLPSHYAQPKIDEIYPLNYVAWSLTLEFAVNVAYAATFRFWTTARIYVLLGVAFLSLCFCVAHYGTLDGGPEWANAPVGIARVVYGFAIGLLMFRLYKQKPFALHLPWWAVIVFALAIFFYEPPYFHALYQIVAVSVFAPLIVALAVANEPPKFMEKFCAMAGLFSYVVYSLHAPMIGYFLRGEDRLHIDLTKQTWTAAFAFTLLLGVTCFAAHNFYDKPLRRFLSKRWVWKGMTRQPSAQATASAA